jgi:predicted outer membrane protein
MSSCTNSLTHVCRLLLLTALPACHAAPASAPDAPRLGEPAVAALVLLANSAEVSHAQLAASRTTRPDVQALAQRMATDHASLNATFNDILAQMDVTPADAPLALALRERSNTQRLLLRDAAARSFDSVYAQMEVDTHRELLQLIDRQLLPSAHHSELREYLMEFRPAVRAHLAHAEQLRATLAAR